MHELRFPDLSDFCKAEASDGRAGVYLLMSGGLVVYAGQTGCLAKRLPQHRAGAKSFDEVLFYPVSDETSRLRIETHLVVRFLPRHNHAVSLGIDGGAGKVWERSHANPWRRWPPRRKK